MSLPKLPSRPALPGRRLPDLPGLEIPEVPKPAPRFGFGVWADGLPPRSLEYLREAYEYFKLDPRVPPTHQEWGTIPEMVVMGGLIERNFEYGQHFGRGFDFQSELLGGRNLPGGAVVDVVVYHNARVVGVRVQSVFHGLRSPFGGGGAKVEEDINQRIRLETRGSLDGVVDVNANQELELGPDPLVDREFERILEG